MRSKPMILAALLLAAFLVNLDTTLVNVALPALTRELHATTTQLQWVVDAYNLVFAALLLTFGSLSDRFGRKGMLLAGLAVVRRGQPGRRLHDQPGAADRGQGGDGPGGRDDVPRDALADHQRLHGTAGTGPRDRPVGRGRRRRDRAGADRRRLAARALQLGQHLRRHGPGRGARRGAGGGRRPASKDPDAAPVDVPGLVLSSAAMALLVFTIIEAPTYGWAAARSLAGFAVSARAARRVHRGERRAAHPMLDVRLFRNMRFSAASGAVTVAFFTLFGFIFLMTQYFQFVRGYGAAVHRRAAAAGGAVGRRRVRSPGRSSRCGRAPSSSSPSGSSPWPRSTAGSPASTSATLSYGIIAVQMVLYGLGMGLTSAPATESIMGAISRQQGRGRFGRQRRHPADRRHPRRGRDRQRLRLRVRVPADRHPAGGVPGRVAADRAPVGRRRVRRGGPGRRPGHGALGQAVRNAATNAFLHGLSIGCLVAGGVAAAGAVLAVLFLPAQPTKGAQSDGSATSGAETSSATPDPVM